MRSIWLERISSLKCSAPIAICETSMKPCNYLMTWWIECLGCKEGSSLSCSSSAFLPSLLQACSNSATPTSTMPSKSSRCPKNNGRLSKFCSGGTMWRALRWWVWICCISDEEMGNPKSSRTASNWLTGTIFQSNSRKWNSGLSSQWKLRCTRSN